MDPCLIENHGIIGNMRAAALVCTDGSIDFFCYPEFDSPSVFANLVSPGSGGIFRIDPELENARTRQMYLPDTNILLTRFLSEDGVAEIIDFMPVSKAANDGPDAHHIVRTAKVIRGEVRFRLLCAPRFDYARSSHVAERHGETICFRPATGPAMALRSTICLAIDASDAVADFTLSAGECASFAFGSLAPDEQGTEERLPVESVENHFQTTTAFWRDWIRKSRYTGRWREVVNRSALVLKLLTSHEHGSLIAAATFGLPEQKGGGRNWDYRYTWLRDSSFSLYAFMRLGFTEEAINFTQWLRARFLQSLEKSGGEVQMGGPGPLQVMYCVDGGTELQESTLEDFNGYFDSKPVRIGNGAAKQLQLDIYGELMDAVYLANKYTSGISNDGWHRLQQILGWLAENWQRDDEGIWEVRDGRHHFLHSRLMCWVAFDRAIRLAQKRSLVAPLAKWFEIRDAIHEDVYKNFWSDKLQAFVQSQGSETLDAATLLMPMLRFISPADPQWISTMKAIEEHLTEDALVYRYGNPDGLEGKEGSFTACSFWRIECLTRQGEVEKARLLFDKMLGYANHLGLYAEELSKGGEQLGNYPQALTHLALISAATYLDRKLSNRGDETWQ